MYSDVMGRTQIYLGDDEVRLLDRAARTSGASRSELIRRAVQRVYGGKAVDEQLRGLQESAGSWKDRDFSGADYVDALRGDLNDRVRELGLK